MVKVALQLALLSSPFTAMDMVGGGDPDARTERCLRNPWSLFMITRLSLVEMLFCCVAVDGSAICLLLTIRYFGKLLSALTLK